MAIAFTLLTSGETNGSGGALTTASVITTTNALVLVSVGYRSDSNIVSPNTTATSVSGLGLTWVRGADTNAPLGGGRIAACFRSMGAGASGTVTITGPSDAVGFTYAVTQVTGVDTSGTGGAGAVNNASPLAVNGIVLNGPQPTVTIPGTPAAGDVTFAQVTTEDAESGLTEEAGWTNILRLIGTQETSLDVMYSTSQDQTATWSGCRTDGREGIAVGALIKLAPLVIVNDGPRGDRRPFPFTPSSAPQRR